MQNETKDDVDEFSAKDVDSKQEGDEMVHDATDEDEGEEEDAEDKKRKPETFHNISINLISSIHKGIH